MDWLLPLLFRSSSILWCRKMYWAWHTMTNFITFIDTDHIFYVLFYIIAKLSICPYQCIWCSIMTFSFRVSWWEMLTMSLQHPCYMYNKGKKGDLSKSDEDYNTLFFKTQTCQSYFAYSVKAFLNNKNTCRVKV